MYLRKKKIKALKIKNVLLVIFFAFEIAFSGTYIVSEFVYYRDDPETAWGAVSMKSSIVFLSIAALLFIIALISIVHIGNASFFSSYFEGDLDGEVSFADLAKVVGKSENAVRRQLHFYRSVYMTGFEFSQDGSGVLLDSRTCLCECRSCGAHIEKKVYFSGECPYCHSSDLHAKVLSGTGFFGVFNDLSSGNGRPDYYRGNSLKTRMTLYWLLFGLGAFFTVILLCINIEDIFHYFDQEYQKEVLLDPNNHLKSYELIKAHLLNSIVYTSIIWAVIAPLTVLRFRRVMAISTAHALARFFSQSRTPFIKAEELPGLAASSKGMMKRMRRAIRKGYARNCTLEVHDGVLMIALAKKTVKDRCLSCGAPLTGVTDENSRCSYCGNLIMGVLEKR